MKRGRSVYGSLGLWITVIVCLAAAQDGSERPNDRETEAPLLAIK